MNKKGFTLVEILSVIVLIALLLGLGIPGISKISSNMKRKSQSTKVSLVEQAGTLWGQANKTMLQTETCNINEEIVPCTKISVYGLIDDEYLDSDTYKKLEFNNSETSESMLNNCVYIYKKNNRVYSYFKGKPDEGEICTPDAPLIEDESILVELDFKDGKVFCQEDKFPNIDNYIKTSEGVSYTVSFTDKNNVKYNVGDTLPNYSDLYEVVVKTSNGTKVVKDEITISKGECGALNKNGVCDFNAKNFTTDDLKYYFEIHSPAGVDLAYLKYKLEDKNGNEIFLPNNLDIGEYKLYIETATGKQYSEPIFVENEPTPSYEGPTVFFENQAYISEILNNIYLRNDENKNDSYDFRIYNDDDVYISGANGINNSNIKYLEPGVYTLEVWGSNSCNQLEDIKTINVYNFPEIKYDGETAFYGYVDLSYIKYYIKIDNLDEGIKDDVKYTMSIELKDGYENYNIMTDNKLYFGEYTLSIGLEAPGYVGLEKEIDIKVYHMPSFSYDGDYVFLNSVDVVYFRNNMGIMGLQEDVKDNLFISLYYLYDKNSNIRYYEGSTLTPGNYTLYVEVAKENSPYLVDGDEIDIVVAANQQIYDVYEENYQDYECDEECYYIQMAANQLIWLNTEDEEERAIAHSNNLQIAATMRENTDIEPSFDPVSGNYINDCTGNELPIEEYYGYVER